MGEAQRDLVLEIPNRIFRSAAEAPVRVPEVLGWIEQNAEEFQGLLGGFDAVINDFNSRATADVSYKNFSVIKEVLGDQRLPTTHEMLSENGRDSALSYIKVIRDMKEQMLRGQKPDGERVEPWMAYHTTKTDLKTLVIASIFHTYEEMIKNRPEFRDKSFEQDRITEALMEVASEHRDLGLFDALARKDGMDWVDGYEGFTSDFRHKNGYK